MDDGWMAVIDSPIGRLGLGLRDGDLGSVVFSAGEALRAPRDAAGCRVAEAIEHYFEDGSAGFHLSLKLAGTDFQRRVWHALMQIPPGETVTYGELAARLGSGARAVAGACRSNPVPVVVPCHRVVSASGLGGYSGAIDGPMLDIKRWLLAHEGVALA